jgi:type IV fimbrial biogenesis protein FimT
MSLSAIDRPTLGREAAAARRLTFAVHPSRHFEVVTPRDHDQMAFVPNQSVLPPTRFRRRAGGFTLIELLVTLAIAAILVALAAPAMSSFLAEQAAAGNADELAATFRSARSEAIKRSASVTVCASRDGATCDADNDADADDWAAGWIVATASGSVLRVQNGLSAMSSMNGDVGKVTFAPNGLVTDGGDSDFIFVPTGGDTALQRVVHLDVQGKVQVTKGGSE